MGLHTRLLFHLRLQSALIRKGGLCVPKFSLLQGSPLAWPVGLRGVSLEAEARAVRAVTWVWAPQGPDLALSPVVPQIPAQVLSSDGEAGAGKSPAGVLGDPGLYQRISHAP